MENFHALTPGYRLNSQTVSRDLFRLTAAILAFEDLGKAGGELKEMRNEQAEDEIAHLLVGSALANRLQLEHMHPLRSDPQELSFKSVDGDCGNWGVDHGYDGPRPLSFREACNKIIHAEATSLFTHEMPPLLYLNGKQGQSRWKVKIDLLAYIRLSFRNFADGLN